MSAFSNDIYLQEQARAIRSRVESGEGRLYLEFGGKLIGDFHAARVLPGFDPDVKLHLLKKLAPEADIIICIHAEDIERKRIRADFGITYDNASLKLIDDLNANGVSVTGVVITRFSGQPSALDFKKRLERHGMKVFLHSSIDGYPNDLEKIASAEGFGSNEYIPVTQPLVVLTGPGPNSGKMGTCLNQMYHEFKQGRAARYAKFETFPVWNLPLNHPVNIAYEAATADLQDNNAIDNFHFEAYGKMAVNYNRDLQAFPLLRAMLTKITGSPDGYQSPTDMGVNCIAAGIVDDEAVCKAARMEIIRRYFKYEAERNLGRGSEQTVCRVSELIQKANLKTTDRVVVAAAREAAVTCEKAGKGDGGIYCGAAIQLHDGTVITGGNSGLMHSAAAMVLKAASHLAGIPEGQHLLLPDIIDSVASFKHGLGTTSRVGINLSEALTILVVSAARDEAAKRALDKLQQLNNCDVHLSHLPGHGDEVGLRHLGLSYTYDPLPPTRKLFP